MKIKDILKDDFAENLKDFKPIVLWNERQDYLEIVWKNKSKLEKQFGNLTFIFDAHNAVNIIGIRINQLSAMDNLFNFTPEQLKKTFGDFFIDKVG